ncbi:MAG: DNA repair protein RadA [Chlamydiota bacterium]
MGKQKAVWVCGSCGNKQSKWAGNCNVCHEWNTFSEEEVVDRKQVRFETAHRSGAKPVRIQDVTAADLRRLQTGYRELDRLVGGGVVAGSLNLIGGEPGIGKSTLLLQLAKQYADQGLIVLYVCGEESVEQTSLRAKRLGIQSEGIFLLSETLFASIRRQVEVIKPDVLIIDSVQIVYKGEIPSVPGSVTQVREVALECMHLAKGSGITTFLIGHVTKSGELAGPRILEHLVDTVFEFEGDREHGYRLLRSVKNRFGPTEDVALFQMGEQGLSEVFSPSKIFLEERIQGAVGSVIIPTVEGTRAMLIEVQALATPSAFSTASRRSTGIDPKRLTLLLAVLEKQMGYKLHALDVFVSVVGGMKMTEPAVDLGIVLAIASSYCNEAAAPDTVIFGEVGLGGEVRAVPRLESRLKEAVNMGFKRCILPAKALSHIHKEVEKDIALCGVKCIEEAIEKS